MRLREVSIKGTEDKLSPPLHGTALHRSSLMIHDFQTTNNQAVMNSIQVQSSWASDGDGTGKLWGCWDGLWEGMTPMAEPTEATGSSRCTHRKGPSCHSTSSLTSPAGDFSRCMLANANGKSKFLGAPCPGVQLGWPPAPDSRQWLSDHDHDFVTPKSGTGNTW